MSTNTNQPQQENSKTTSTNAISNQDRFQNNVSPSSTQQIQTITRENQQQNSNVVEKNNFETQQKNISSNNNNKNDDELKEPHTDEEMEDLPPPPQQQHMSIHPQSNRISPHKAETPRKSTMHRIPGIGNDDDNSDDFWQCRGKS